MNQKYSLVILLLLASCASDKSRNTSPSTQLDQAIIDRLPVMMDAYDVDGMAVSVVSNQEVLLSAGYGKTKDGAPFTASTPCPVYSATKTFTSLAIAALVEDGVFDINTPLRDHLPDAPDLWKDIPFWRLLNHTSGITMIVNRPEFEGLVENPQSSNKDVYNFVRAIPMDYSPGEYSRYRQSGYGIAEMIIGDKLGSDWPAIVKQQVTQPANVNQTVHTELHSGKRSVPLLTSAGGYETTSNDIAKIFMTLNRGDIVSPVFFEQWLYNDTYNVDGYSLGSVLVEIGDIRTVGHSGGGRANLRYAPSRGVGVMVCTDDRQNKNIMHDVANMLMREVAAGESTLLPVQTKLHALGEKSATEIIAAYNVAKNMSPPMYDFVGVENTLNQIGYNLLAKQRASEAIDIFRLNTREYPLSANVYDSLGETLLSIGDLNGALSNYQKVLELDSDNKHAASMINKIKADMK